jgi:four helix bundle protein
MNDQPIFDHEKLDVYQVELSFITWSSVLLSEIRAAGEGLYREVCDQLDRASLSSLLNTAEGNGKRQGKQRAKFFDDARGSAVECAACLDALVARKLAAIERVDEGKRLLFRTVGILTKLVERFDSYRAREDEEPTDEDNRPGDWTKVPLSPHDSCPTLDTILRNCRVSLVWQMGRKCVRICKGISRRDLRERIKSKQKEKKLWAYSII